MYSRQAYPDTQGALWGIDIQRVDGNQLGWEQRGHIGHRQPVRQGHIVGHTGAVNCTYRGYRQPARQGARSGAHWGSQLYIQRAQKTSQTGDTWWGTVKAYTSKV